MCCDYPASAVLDLVDCRVSNSLCNESEDTGRVHCSELTRNKGLVAQERHQRVQVVLQHRKEVSLVVVRQSLQSMGHACCQEARSAELYAAPKSTRSSLHLKLTLRVGRTDVDVNSTNTATCRNNRKH